MESVKLETFLGWIEEAYPEISIIGPDKYGERFLSLAGIMGPMFCEKGIEVGTPSDDLPWDYTAQEIEWKACDLLDGAYSGEIDFRAEAEELLEIGKKVRKKLEAAGKKKDIGCIDEIRGGMEYSLLPFEDRYIDEIDDAVSNFFNAVMEDDSESSRMTYRDYLEKEEGN